MKQNKNVVEYSKKIITVPNILSFVRILLIPIIVWSYCVKEDSLLTAVILFLSGVTDVVDGIIARRFNMVSDFGKALDPIADKLTQIAMLFCLVTSFPNMLVPLILLAVKELVAGISGLVTIHKTKIVMGADWHGKATTVVLYATMTVHLLWRDIPGRMSNILIGICVFMMCLSFVMYTIRNFKAVREAECVATYSKRKENISLTEEYQRSELVRRILWGVLELFAIVSMIYFLATGKTSSVTLCVISLVLFSIPEIIQRLFNCRFNNFAYIFALLYALGAMLGDSYDFYQLVPWWDSMLHTAGGVAFCIFGIFLSDYLNKGSRVSVAMCALFGICLSITFSALWEIYEFGSDMLFDTDMQRDTVISEINSYHFGGDIGEVGRIENIDDVAVNGNSIELGGYLDIGLWDTMSDMIVESLGAVVYGIIYWIDDGKHPALISLKKKAREDV